MEKPIPISQGREGEGRTVAVTRLVVEVNTEEVEEEDTGEALHQAGP